MESETARHLRSREITAYFLGEADPGEEYRIEMHLAGCTDCTRIARQNYRLLGFQPVTLQAPVRATAPAQSWFPGLVPGLAMAAAVLLTVILIARYPARNLVLAALSGTRLERLAPLLAGADADVIRDGHLTIRASAQIEPRGLDVSPQWKGFALALAETGELMPPPNIAANLRNLATLKEVSRLIGQPGAAERNEVQLVTPHPSAMVQGKPLFRWDPISGARQYRLYVNEYDSNKEIEEQDAAGSTLSLESGEFLVAGRTYQWSVEAQLDSRVAYSEWRVFQVADQATLDAVAALKARFNGSAMMLAAVYEHYGLYDEAAEQLQRLRDLNPKNAEVARMVQKLNELERGKETTQ